MRRRRDWPPAPPDTIWWIVLGAFWAMIMVRVANAMLSDFAPL